MEDETKIYVYVGKYGYYRKTWRTICICSSYQRAKIRMEEFARKQTVDWNSELKVWINEIDWDSYPIKSNYTNQHGQKKFDKIVIIRVDLDG